MNDAPRKNKGPHATVGNGQRTLYTRAERPAGRYGMGMDRQRAEDRAPMARRTGIHSPWRRPVPRAHALAATGLALTLGLALLGMFALATITGLLKKKSASVDESKA